MSRTIPRLDENSEENTMVILSIIIYFILVIILSTIMIYFEGFIIDYTFLKPSQKYIIYIGLLYFAISNLVRLISEVLKSYKKISESNVISRWVFPISEILTVFVFSLFITSTIISVFYSLIIASIITILFGFYTVISQTSFNPTKLSWNITPIKSFLVFFTFTAIAGIFTSIQFIAPNLAMFTISEVQAGAFGVVLILGNISRVPLISINQIFPQVATELYKENKIDEINKLFKSTSKIAIYFTTIPLIVFTIFHKEVVMLFSEQYIQYSIALPIVMFGQVFAVGIGTVGLLILMTDKTKSYCPIRVIYYCCVYII